MDGGNSNSKRGKGRRGGVGKLKSPRNSVRVVGGKSNSKRGEHRTNELLKWHQTCPRRRSLSHEGDIKKHANRGLFFNWYSRRAKDSNLRCYTYLKQENSNNKILLNFRRVLRVAKSLTI